MNYYNEKTFVQAEIPQEEDKKFEQEVLEFLVLTNDSDGSATGSDETYWTASKDILAVINVKTGELFAKDGRIVWVLTKEEKKKEMYFNRFKNGSIYRILARRLKEDALPPGDYIEAFYNQYYIVKVLEEEVRNEKMAEILREYRKEIVIEDELLGKLVLDKNIDAFVGEFERNGESVDIYLDVYKNDLETLQTALNYCKKVFSEYEKCDKEMREFAAKELTENANDWKDDDEEQDGTPPITEKVFAERITLCEFSMDSKGNFSGFYDDDDMFWGHTILVEGTLNDGFESANIAG